MPSYLTLTAIVLFAIFAQSKEISVQDGTTSSLVIDLGYEIYKGFYNSSAKQNVWQGIRYAAPPVGEHRWLAPRAPEEDRRMIRGANALPTRCPQGPQAPYPNSYDYMGSEDCLFLSVYSPINAHNLPVFVWIHGGGYGGGQGNQDVGNISSISPEKFVSVVIQYRLGAFGFLAGDEVHKSGDLNAGLLDQHFALQWIQRHISKFGGDSRRVTIAGESAGAGSVMLQAMAHGGTLGTSLFENVIAASPYLPTQRNYNDRRVSQAYYDFAAAAGCLPGGTCGTANTTVLDCLRKSPSELLQKASAEIGASGTWGTWAFVPVTDGHFIRERPSQQLATGHVNGLRVMSGNNANEGAAFVDPDIVTEADFKTWLRQEYDLLTDADINEILGTHYPTSNGETLPFATCGNCAGPTAVNVGSFAVGQFQRALNLYSETTFACPSYWLADAYGRQNTRRAYKYQFSIPAAQHGADLYAEGLRAEPPNISPQFYQAFTTMWGNMITVNNPSISDELANGNGSRELNAASDWPNFTTRGDRAWQMLNLNQTGGVPYSAHVVAYPVQNATQLEGPGLRNDIRIVNAYDWEGGRGARCEFWKNIGERALL